MSTFQDKMHNLKKEFAYIGDNEAITMVNQWEDRFARLQVKREWITSPDTMALRDLVVEQLRNIISVLANKEDLSPDERIKLFAEKKCHFLYLTHLTEDPTGEMDVLQKKAETQQIN